MSDALNLRIFHSMTLFLTALGMALVTAIVLWRVIRLAPAEKPGRRRTIFMINAAVGMLLGLPVLYFASEEVNYGIAVRSWPEATGEVISTAVSDNRQQRPEITVRFTVDQAMYTSVCDLGVSGFGSTKTRGRTANRILGEYPVGSVATVRYNPLDPTEATLRLGLRWAPLMRMIVGSLFGATGLFFLLAGLIPLHSKNA